MQKIINKFFLNFFTILSNALFCMALYCTIFEWNRPIYVRILWQLIAVSVLCTFTMRIFHSKNELSRKQMKTRIIIHFIIIISILLLSAFLFGWIGSENRFRVVIFAILCTITYWSVMLIINLRDEKLAKKLNMKIKELQNSR